MIINILL